MLIFYEKKLINLKKIYIIYWIVIFKKKFISTQRFQFPALFLLESIHKLEKLNLIYFY